MFTALSLICILLWCSGWCRLGGLHSSLLIFSKLIWLIYLCMWLSNTLWLVALSLIVHSKVLVFYQYVLLHQKFDSALKGSWLLSIYTASWKMIPFRMSQIKTQFLVCYLLSKTFSTNSAITKRKYVSKLMKSQLRWVLFNIVGSQITSNALWK